MTGYPSIDKPWLKYYRESEQRNQKLDVCMYQYMYENNVDYQNDIALRYMGEKVTYGELIENINRVAEAFWEIGVREGDFVYFLSVSTPELIYSMYALNRIGAVPNMLEPRNNVERIQGFIEKKERKFVVILEPLLAKFKDILSSESIEKVIVLSPVTSSGYVYKAIYGFRKKKSIAYSERFMRWNYFVSLKSKTEIQYYDKSKEVAIIEYTSGTTGVAKGAMLSDESWNQVADMSKISKIAGGGRCEKLLLIMPPFIAYGVLAIHAGLSFGAELIIIPKFEPEKFAAYVNKYKPSVIMGVPAHWERLVDSPECKDLSFLKTIIAGGDKMSVDTEKRINERLKILGCTAQVRKGYGMTELCSVVVYSKDECNKLGSVGIPYIRNNVKIIDNEENELTYGETGELCVSGPSILTGYFENRAEEDKIFLYDNKGVKWVRTGDIATIDQDGFVTILDRKKRMIVRPDGHNVFPNVIETVLSEHNSVKACAVVGMKDSNVQNGRWPVAFIVPVDEARGNEDNLREDLLGVMQQKIPERDKAEKIIFINELPLTPTDKIDYRSLELAAAE